MKKKYWNNQKYSECQLVAIWNAAIYLGIDAPKQYGKEYKEDCTKGGCLYGSCINIDHVLEKLNTQMVAGDLNKKWMSENFPVIYSVFSPSRGLHATTAIGIDGDKIILANYPKNRIYKMTIERLMKIQYSSFKPQKITKIITEKE